jgi:GNAT superfamily N-acetyltransferase
MGRPTTTTSLVLGDRWCANERVAVAYLNLSPSELDVASEAVGLGFEIVELRVVLGLNSQPEPPLAVDIRPATSEDIPVLEDIASTAYRGITRFYEDTGFPRSQCDELYRVWIRRSIEGWADFVLVADHGDGPVGYTSGHVDRSTGTARVGLLGVAQEARGSGVGRQLAIAHAIQSGQLGITRLRFPTQASNDAILRLLAGLGWTLHGASIWLHKWYDPSGSERANDVARNG